MLRRWLCALTVLLFTFSTTLGCQAQASNADVQIAEALLPAPVALREGATVMGYADDGTFVTLREGTNALTCLADKPGDDRFHASCYHQDLEPFMARGRALRAEGITGQESLRVRHEEVEAGTLPMPSGPAAVFNVSSERAAFDPATAAVTLYAVYIPYATEASTGISEVPGPPGTPWIMRAGTPSAHIMIVTPQP